jgi:hypothetical protein
VNIVPYIPSYNQIRLPLFLPLVKYLNSLYYTVYFYAIHFSNILQKNLAGISHNVSAVYDVLPARIRALRSKDQGWQNVGGVSRGSGAQRNDLGERNPEPPTGGEA